MDLPDDSEFQAYAAWLNQATIWGIPLREPWEATEYNRQHEDCILISASARQVVDRELAYFGWCVRNDRRVR